MTRVDLLVLNGTLVTMDKDRRVIEDGGVAVTGRAHCRSWIAARHCADVRRAGTNRRSGQDHYPGIDQRAHARADDPVSRTG